MAFSGDRHREPGLLASMPLLLLQYKRDGFVLGEAPGNSSEPTAGRTGREHGLKDSVFMVLTSLDSVVAGISSLS